MKKKEFLGASLQTGLKGIAQNENYTGEIETVVGLQAYKTRVEVITDIDNIIIQDFELILRPLPDMTKCITHNGKMFVPIVELAKMKVALGIQEDIAPSINFDCKIVKNRLEC